MSENAPPPLPPFLQTEKVEARPSFFGALRGVWLLTWRAQLTWRRLPARILPLLIVPFLVYLTVFSPERWQRSRFSLTHLTPPQMNRLFKRLKDAGHPIKQEQQRDMFRIFAEEYSTTQREMNEAANETDPSARARRQHEAVAACTERILSRAQQTLDQDQFTKFKSFENDNRMRMEQLINNHQEGWGRSEPFYHWLVDVYFFIVLPLSCVRGCGALMRDELLADTLGFLVTRPVSRARLLIVKYISQLGWLQILLLTETLLIFAAGWVRQIPGLGGLLPLFLAAQLLAVAAWSALGTLLGQFTNRYMAIGLVYGAIVEMGIGRIPTNINVISVMRHLKTLLSHNEALQGIYNWPADGTTLSVCALIVAPILFMSVAAALFSFLEYLPASEMQK